MIRDNADARELYRHRCLARQADDLRARGAVRRHRRHHDGLFVSGAYPEFAYWTISGEGIFINMLGGVTTFLGPMVGTVLLLILNDTVTRLTEYYGIVLGIVILFFAIGLRKGLMDFVRRMVRSSPSRKARTERD